MRGGARRSNMKTKKEFTIFLSRLNAAGKLTGAIKEAISRHERRESNTAAPKLSLRDRGKLRRVIIPLGKDSNESLVALIRGQHPRRKNWTIAIGVAYPATPFSHDEDWGAYSTKCKFRHWEYTPSCGCYAAVGYGGKSLVFCYAAKKTVLAPPHGYKWDKDQDGIRLVSLTDSRKDYHPNSDDLRSYSRSAIRAKILANFARRQVVEKDARAAALAVKAAEAEGLAVCMRDSLSAGNCEAGTMSFARLHDLDPQKHYCPTVLLKKANGQLDRVRLAVAVGLRRHRREMKNGICFLADHR